MDVYIWCRSTSARVSVFLLGLVGLVRSSKTKDNDTIKFKGRLNFEDVSRKTEGEQPLTY